MVKMINWFKNISNKFSENLDFKRTSDFNFEKYILGLGFKFVSEKNDFKLYVNNYDGIKINLIINLKDEKILISQKGEVLTRINFIPNGSLFVDMLINQTVNSIKKNYVLEQ